MNKEQGDLTSEFGIFWGDEIFNYSEEKKAIIENILYERDCMWITGKAGEGKSLVAKALICNLTTGTPFLDTYAIPEPQNVLYVQTEGDRSETLERVHLLTQSLPIDNNRWVHMNWDGLMLNTEAGFKLFMDKIRLPNMKYDVIILDPLYTTVKGSMSSDDVATDWIRNMRKVRKEYNCAFIVLGHDGKDGFDNKGKKIDKGMKNLFGSTLWGAFMNQNFNIAKTDDIIRLTRGKQRNNKIVDLIEMRLVETDTMLKLNNKEDLSDTRSIQVLECVEKHNGDEKKVSAKQILKETGINQSTVYRSLTKLEKEKRVEKVKVNRGYVFQLPSKVKGFGSHNIIPATNSGFELENDTEDGYRYKPTDYVTDVCGYYDYEDYGVENYGVKKRIVDF